MTDIKLILADLDGTLLDENGNLSPRTKEVVNKLREKEILFSFASGRNKAIMTHFVEELNIDIPYISDNGANIYKGDECLSSNNFDNSYNNFILKVLSEEWLPFNAYSDVSAYYNLESPKLKIVRDRLGDKLKHEIFVIKDFSDEHFFKITMDSINHEDMDRVVDKIMKECPNVNMKKAEGTFYTIVAKGIDKGTSCLKLANMLNIKPENMMVLGDNNNDTSMFKVAGASVCVSNAKEDIKAQANYICDTNSNEGPIKFFEEFFKL